MKMITAIVQPFMLSKVTGALEEISGFPGMTVMEVRGFGREKSTHEVGVPHRALEDVTEYTKKVRIEVVAHNDMVDQIVQVIKQMAHTGNRGDGKIFVWPIEHAVRIKTGETGEAAV